MSEYGIPEYDDYFNVTKFNNDDLINFAYTLDDKKMSLPEIERYTVKVLKDNGSIELLQLFYENHLDMFVRNQSEFTDQLKDPQFMLKRYLKYRLAFANLSTYFNGLKLHNRLTPEITSPKSFFRRLSKPELPKLNVNTKFSNLSPIKAVSFDILSPTNSSSISPSLSFTGYFDKYPKESIFNNVPPEEFAKTCNKLFVYYYFMMETRSFQYVSKHDTVEMGGYAGELKGFYNNFYRKLEYEVELFCLAGNFKALVQVFIILTTTLLQLGNVPLGKVTMSLIERFKMCKESKIQEYKLSLKEMKEYNKYPYLVDPDSILRGFISSHEIKTKMKAFSKLFEKITETKKLLLANEEISVQPTASDFEVYNYLTPFEVIKLPLYTGRGEIQCLKERCNESKNRNNNDSSSR
jgi:hypothetical protein